MLSLSDSQLWYALGKLKAEKAAWRIADSKGLKLATICPALITGPDFFQLNSTSTLAYLKGNLLKRTLVIDIYDHLSNYNVYMISHGIESYIYIIHNLTYNNHALLFIRNMNPKLCNRPKIMLNYIIYIA